MGRAEPASLGGEVGLRASQETGLWASPVPGCRGSEQRRGGPLPHTFSSHSLSCTALPGTISPSEAGRCRTSRAPKAGYQPGFLFQLHASPPCPTHSNQRASLPLELTCFPPKQRQPDVSTLKPLAYISAWPPLSYLLPTLMAPSSLLHQDPAPPRFSFCPPSLRPVHSILHVPTSSTSRPQPSLSVPTPMCFSSFSLILASLSQGQSALPTFLLPQHTLSGPTQALPSDTHNSHLMAQHNTPEATPPPPSSALPAGPTHSPKPSPWFHDSLSPPPGIPSPVPLPQPPAEPPAWS